MSKIRVTSRNTDPISVKHGELSQRSMCENTKGNEQKTNMQHTLLASLLDSSVENWVDQFLRERFYEDEPGCHFWGRGALCLGGGKLKNTNCHSVDEKPSWL